MAPESERANCAICKQPRHDDYCKLDDDAFQPNEPTLTCSEVVERLAGCYSVKFLPNDGLEVKIDRVQIAAILHSWRERRVQELEGLLAKRSGCSHCNDSASGSTSANDATEIRKGE